MTPCPPGTIRLFLAGDVMPGRGIDQILLHPGSSLLHEGWAHSALDYVALAEARNGPIPRGVPPAYPWGDLLTGLARWQPDLRLVNLETAITVADALWPKGINYRMHPANLPVLQAAGIDACTLANNHVLDWGPAGLTETLQALAAAGIAQAGAGRDRSAALAPLVLTVPGKGRVIVLARGARSSGIPPEWQAGADSPGIALLADPQAVVADVATQLQPIRQPGDIVVFSVHWGGNWGFAIPAAHQALAHALIDSAGVDIVHGHSSHHPLAAEVHAGKLILYGCGDLLNDYEGISGHAEFRPDLALAWIVDMAPATGRLLALHMLPFRLQRFRLVATDAEEAEWLAQEMGRECARFGGRIAQDAEGTLSLALPTT